MKRYLIAAAALIAVSGIAAGQDFDRDFENRTLRLDYIFSGDAESQAIHFQEAFVTDGWAGRRTHLAAPLLEGCGQVEVYDGVTGARIYAQSFATLFQEWQATREATLVDRAFENCIQVPFPRRSVEVRVTLRDFHGLTTAELVHIIDPRDILIRPLEDGTTPFKYLHRGGDPAACIDIAILAEGYTAKERAKFYRDAARAAKALLSHEPFASMPERFNIVAVAAVSEDSGVSVPHEHEWRHTVASSQFDTFYSERYLTTQQVKAVYDALVCVPFEQVIVLANTSTYGGGGIYNSITLVASDHPSLDRVVVHEFGHAFAGLGDEYYYDDQYASHYPADTEPWEPNLTTLVHFEDKWEDLLDTPGVGVFEGGGYQSKGVYRPAEDCRMKTNSYPDFCPVCTRAIVRMVEYCTSVPGRPADK